MSRLQGGHEAPPNPRRSPGPRAKRPGGMPPNARLEGPAAMPGFSFCAAGSVSSAPTRGQRPGAPQGGRGRGARPDWNRGEGEGDPHGHFCSGTLRPAFAHSPGAGGRLQQPEGVGQGPFSGRRQALRVCPGPAGHLPALCARAPLAGLLAFGQPAGAAVLVRSAGRSEASSGPAVPLLCNQGARGSAATRWTTPRIRPFPRLWPAISWRHLIEGPSRQRPRGGSWNLSSRSCGNSRPRTFWRPLSPGSM